MINSQAKCSRKLGDQPPRWVYTSHSLPFLTGFGGGIPLSSSSSWLLNALVPRPSPEGSWSIFHGCLSWGSVWEDSEVCRLPALVLLWKLQIRGHLLLCPSFPPPSLSPRSFSQTPIRALVPPLWPSGDHGDRGGRWPEFRLQLQHCLAEWTRQIPCLGSPLIWASKDP